MLQTHSLTLPPIACAQVELRRLPTVRAIEQQREAARAVHSRLAGNDRDGLAKVKRVLEKCKVAEERRQEMEGKARRLRLAVLKRVQPYLTEVARIAKSVGFPDPLAGALKALGVEEGSEEADSDAVMDVLGGVPRGRYHNPILREDVLRGQPDESPRRARGRRDTGWDGGAGGIAWGLCFHALGTALPDLVPRRSQSQS